ALIEGERTVTFGELFELRNRLANSLLDLGLKKGEHGVVYSLNSIEYMLSGSAVRALGALSVPMNHRLVAEEVSYILDDSDAVLVFVGDGFLPVVEQVRTQAAKVRHWILIGLETRDWALDLDDLIKKGGPDPATATAGLTEGLGGSMIYTAGTTGKPKGARRTNADAQIALGWLQTFNLADSSHVHLIAGPLYHSAPAAFAGFAQLAGSTCVLMRKFDPEKALALIEKHRCTSTFMAPTLLKRILDLPEEVRSGYDVSSMRVIVVAGAPCPMRVKEDALNYFGPALYEFYGSTELGINTILRPEDMLRKPGSSGKVPDGMEVAIFDDEGNRLPPKEPGELYIRRYASVFDEYYKKPEATAETARGEWVSVGDVAYLDEEGFVFICDRKRDMIISGGVNIYPAEIEDVLHRHPLVLDAAVFGVPDEEWGERVHAAIQLRRGAAVGEEQIIGFCREHLAGYKVPREVSFHEDFPRDTAGKLVKRVLRDPYWAGRASRV
ncbi:MAG: AMP-binding protein, partial [Actinomycetota bacterium]